MTLPWEQTWNLVPSTLCFDVQHSTLGVFKVENGPRFGAIWRVVLKVILEVNFGTLRQPLSATQTEFQSLATCHISTQHLSLREQYV